MDNLYEKWNDINQKPQRKVNLETLKLDDRFQPRGRRLAPSRLWGRLESESGEHIKRLANVLKSSSAQGLTERKT
jgi:hypothetical protein